MDALETDLLAFVSTLRPSGEPDNPTLIGEGGYFLTREEALPDYLFNKHIVPKGYNRDFPDGALGIFVDEDFWAVAALPARFQDLSIERLVALLWPDIALEVAYGPDTQQLLSHQ